MPLVKSSRRAMLGIVFVMASSSVVMSQDKLSDADKKWLEEEASALITAEEVDIFESLQSKDRNLFKEVFWARRDFDAMTPENEFLRWYEERVRAADKAVTQVKRGSRSDMGMVYILFGEPETTQPENTWTYAANASLGIPGGYTFQFSESPAGPQLARTDEVEGVLERAKRHYVANRALAYIKDGEGRLQKPAARFDPKSPVKDSLLGLIANKAEDASIPFEVRSFFFRSSEGADYIPILFEIDANALTWSADKTSLTIFGAAQDSEGHVLYPFDETVELSKNDAGRVVYDVPMELPPGDYTLCFGLMDMGSSKVGTRVLEVEVPDLMADGLQLSSTLVYTAARQVTEYAGVPGHAFQFGPVQFVPKEGTPLTFSRDETLGILYFVYGFGANPAGQPSITGQYVFSYQGNPKGQTAPEALQASPQHAVGNTEIPLASFEPGKYVVQIKVTDQVTHATATRDIEFLLE